MNVRLLEALVAMRMVDTSELASPLKAPLGLIE